MKAHKKLSDIIRIILGLLITAVAYQIFLTPYDISVGGLTGAAVIINKYFGIPCTATLFFLNIALFAWGVGVKGRAYILRTLAATIALGVLLDIPVPFLASLSPQSQFAALVFGSLLTGVGYGLVVSADTSTGGSDLMAAIVTKRLKFLTIGMVMDFIDLVVIAAGAFYEGIKTLPPSLVAVFVCNALIDITAYSFGAAEFPNWLSRVLPEKTRRHKQFPTEKFRYIPYAVLMASLLIVLIRAYAIRSGIHQAAIV